MGRLATGLMRGVIVLAVVVVAACTAQYRDHGFVPSDDDLTRIVVGESTRDDVGRIVGRPTSTGVLSGSGWYYVGSRFRHYGLREPREVERQVVAISFDEQGLVENVERYTLEDGRIVTISRRVTDSNVKGLSFLRQLLGNIGNLSADQIVGDQ